MYLDFYGLSEKPFSQTPDPRFLYWNDAYRETLASLRYGIEQRKGFIAMIGEAGTGKTTLLRKLLDDLGPDVMSVFLFNPNATFEEILEYTLSELGIAAPSGRKLAMLQRLNEFLLAAFGEGRNTILLIDEAQDLEADVLESLRLLSNLETAEEKILQIVLSGQPELADKLADPGLRQLKQRIAVRCRLEPLKREELGSYVGARLAVAGGASDLFSPETLEPIWQFTGGIPRLINTVCDNSLLLGYALGKRTIGVEVLSEVISDLGQLDIGTRPRTEAAPSHTEDLPLESPRVESTDSARVEAGTAGSEPTRIEIAAPPLSYPSPPSASFPTRQGSAARLPWLVAAVCAGALLLFVGAWLGRETSPGVEPAHEGVARSAPGDEAKPEPPATNPEAAGHESPAESRTLGDAPPATNELLANSEAPADDTAPEPVLEGDVPRVPSRLPPRELPQDSLASVSAGDRDTTAPGSSAEPTLVVPASDPPAASDQPSAHESEPQKEDASAASSAEKSEVRTTSAESQPRRDASKSRGSGVEAPTVAMTRPDPTEYLARPTSRSADRTPAVRPRNQRAAHSSVPEGRRVDVKPGDTLLNLAAGRYGRSNLTTLDMLQARNPEIRNIDLIIAGSGLDFPEPGPDARLLEDGGGLTVLAMTTAQLSDALALQSSLEGRLGKPVSLQRLDSPGDGNLYRVSVRGLADRSEALQIAQGLGSILQDPAP